METNKTRVDWTPQSTKHQSVAFGDVASVATHAFYVNVPEGSYISDVVVGTETAFAGNSATINVKAGDSGDDDKFMTTTTATTVGTYRFGASNSIPMKQAITTGTYKNQVKLSVVVGTGAPTAGTLYWWVEFRFNPNIVWEQASISNPS